MYLYSRQNKVNFLDFEKNMYHFIIGRLRPKAHILKVLLGPPNGQWPYRTQEEVSVVLQKNYP